MAVSLCEIQLGSTNQGNLENRPLQVYVGFSSVDLLFGMVPLLLSDVKMSGQERKFHIV